MKHLFLALIVLACPFVRGDTIVFKSGGEMHGAVIEETDKKVTIKLKTGTMEFDRSVIASVKKDAPVASLDKLPKWDAILSVALAQPWGEHTEQIPATVIDVGVMKAVPYLSYRAGDYEINIYGDPDAPAGVEIGIYNELLKSQNAKSNCLKFMKSLLKDARQQQLIASLKLEKDSQELEAYTYEITPETDEDAYGGWWISVYSKGALDASRATAAELAAITVKRKAAEAQAAEQKAQLASVKDYRKKIEDRLNDDDWSSSEMSQSRKSSDSNGGSVYVRGYYRSNGTYVHAYNRAAPGHGGGRR